MKQDLTELVFILDKSGSMHGMEEDTIGGFNSTIEKERDKDGDAYVSTVLFSNNSEVLHDRVSIRNIRPMTAEQYRVGGCTALIDAIGGAIHHIGNVHKYAREEDRPARTLFVIITDGMENASCRYSSDEVKQKIERQKKQYDWDFIFLGANIDAVQTAKQFGISEENTANFHNDKMGHEAMSCSIQSRIRSMRSRMPMDGWKAEVDRDYTSRKK